jgi:hypothetical protein
LLYLAPGDIPSPQLLARVREAIALTQAHAITWYSRSFRPGAFFQRKFTHHRMPLGPSLEAGLERNAFGGPSFAVHRDTVNEFGGLDPRLPAGFAAWQFLGRLVLSGKELIVIPDFLSDAPENREDALTKEEQLPLWRAAVEPYAQKLPHPFGRWALSELGKCEDIRPKHD